MLLSQREDRFLWLFDESNCINALHKVERLYTLEEPINCMPVAHIVEIWRNKVQLMQIDRGFEGLLSNHIVSLLNCDLILFVVVEIPSIDAAHMHELGPLSGQHATDSFVWSNQRQAYICLVETFPHTAVHFLDIVKHMCHSMV